MFSPTFLTVNEQPVSLKQAFSCLKLAERLPPLLVTIVSQHALTQELHSRVGLAFPPEAISQLLLDLQSKHELLGGFPSQVSQ
jgi:hypothetical protein